MAKYVVSACLLGCNCKYSGGNNFHPRLALFLQDKEHIAICPEVDGGLATPRPPAEIVGGDGNDVLSGRARVVTSDGADVSKQYLRGAAKAVAAARAIGAREALLKERSPSCAVNWHYDGTFTGTLRRGQGVAAAALARAGVKLSSEENMPGGEMTVDYDKITAEIVGWLRRKIEEAGARGSVLGLSGGIDSAVVAALCCRAFPRDTLGAIIPVFSASADVDDARLVARELSMETVEVDLNRPFEAFVQAIEPGAAPLDRKDMAVANIKPRLRMAVLYYLAAKHNYLVVGTSNKSELITGFFTKHGDGGVDLEPIGDLVKSQVVELAVHLGLPDKIIRRTPSAGLWPGQTDEDELGFTYDQLDQYILTGKTDAGAMEKIKAAVTCSRHKLVPPPVCRL